jgi:hypothetical protein
MGDGQANEIVQQRLSTTSCRVLSAWARHRWALRFKRVANSGRRLVLTIENWDFRKVLFGRAA